MEALLEAIAKHIDGIIFFGSMLTGLFIVICGLIVFRYLDIIERNPKLFLKRDSE